MKEAFVEIAFRRKTLVLIEQANKIIADLQAQGYTLTVRQLHYQFVARDLYKNTHLNYQRLASVVDDARKAGLIDWNAIEDRTRFLRAYTTYQGPKHFLTEMTRRYYMEALWRDQDVYCEVWIEKDALLGVIEKPASKYRVPYMSCRGYMSSSELYEAGKRFARKRREGKRCIIFHLGDHDPSGVNMTDVNRDSVSMFARSNGVEVERLAMTMDQIEEYAPPPNYAKESDARTTGYIEEYGTDECWELDALHPSVIDKLVSDAIEGVLDMERYEARKAEEDAHEQELQAIADDWSDVARYLAYRHRSVDLTAFGESDTAEEVLRQAEQDGEAEE